MEGEPNSKTKTKTSTMNSHLSILSSSTLNLIPTFILQSISATSSFASPLTLLLHLLRHFLLLFLRLLLLLLPSRRSGPHRHQPSPLLTPTTTSPAERALSHVLSVVSRVPVASRKYELVRSLADRILNDNLLFSSASLNREALSSAFYRTIRRLELSVPKKEKGSVDLILGAVKAEMRRWTEEDQEEAAAGERTSAEKTAAEAIWLAGKMAECAAVEEAVRMWGEAAGLAKVALTAEPRIQVAFVRVVGLRGRSAGN